MIRIHLVGCTTQPYVDLGSNLTLGGLRKFIELMSRDHEFDGIKVEIH